MRSVHLVRLLSGGTELICEGLFSHPNEIWDLASCPFDQRILYTVFSSVGQEPELLSATSVLICLTFFGTVGEIKSFSTDGWVDEKDLKGWQRIRSK
ncbi:hypothetical protein OROMI_003281 [Orobanche minor]